MTPSRSFFCIFLAATSTAIPLATAHEPVGSSSTAVAIDHRGAIPSKPGRPFGSAEQGNWEALVNAPAFRELTDADGVVRRVAQRPILGHHVDVVLPDVGRITLAVTGITEVVEGVSTVSGVLAHDTGATFTFSFDGDKVFGSIRDRTYNWDVEPNGESHRLRRVERSFIPAIVDEPIRLPRTDGGKAATHAKIGGTGRVDILFLYANDVSNAASLASNIVSNMNSALTDSQVSSNNYVVSAGVQMINSSFPTQNIEGILFDLAGRDPPFEDVLTDMMFDAGADIALLLIEEDPSMTATDHPVYGRVGGKAVIFDSTAPFAVSTDDYALGNFTALHEIGHVFNDYHEDDNPGINRGKSVPGSNWQTIMASYRTGGCSFAGLPSTCERIRYFSNPAVSYLGTATGDSGSRDMESALESSMAPLRRGATTATRSRPAFLPASRAFRISATAPTRSVGRQ